MPKYFLNIQNEILNEQIMCVIEKLDMKLIFF
jgi:hypothetical protein